MDERMVLCAALPPRRFQRGTLNSNLRASNLAHATREVVFAAMHRKSVANVASGSRARNAGRHTASQHARPWLLVVFGADACPRGSGRVWRPSRAFLRGVPLGPIKSSWDGHLCVIGKARAAQRPQPRTPSATPTPGATALNLWKGQPRAPGAPPPAGAEKPNH